MLAKDKCGCLYLVHNDIQKLVHACDRDGGEDWGTFGGKRQPEDPAALQTVPDEQFERIVREWGDLISDGYSARIMATAFGMVNRRLTPFSGLL